MDQIKEFLTNKKTIVLVLLVILILLMMDMNSRLSDLQRLSTQRDQMSTDVAQLEETRASLMKKLAYATSEVAVEEWARVYNRLSQPGDEVIIPLPTGAVTPTPVIMQPEVARDLQKWEVWKALFFGE
jgi:hypothetical protein